MNWDATEAEAFMLKVMLNLPSEYHLKLGG